MEPLTACFLKCVECFPYFLAANKKTHPVIFSDGVCSRVSVCYPLCIIRVLHVYLHVYLRNFEVSSGECVGSIYILTEAPPVFPAPSPGALPARTHAHGAGAAGPPGLHNRPGRAPQGAIIQFGIALPADPAKSPQIISHNLYLTIFRAVSDNSLYYRTVRARAPPACKALSHLLDSACAGIQSNVMFLYPATNTRSIALLCFVNARIHKYKLHTLIHKQYIEYSAISFYTMLCNGYIGYTAICGYSLNTLIQVYIYIIHYIHEKPAGGADGCWTGPAADRLQIKKRIKPYINGKKPAGLLCLDHGGPGFFAKTPCFILQYA